MAAAQEAERQRQAEEKAQRAQQEADRRQAEADQQAAQEAEVAARMAAYQAEKEMNDTIHAAFMAQQLADDARRANGSDWMTAEQQAAWLAQLEAEAAAQKAIEDALKAAEEAETTTVAP